MSQRIFISLRRIWTLFLPMVAIVGLFLAAGCSQGSKSNLGGEDDVFGDIPVGGFNPSGGGTPLVDPAGAGKAGPDQPKPGSGAGGTFTEQDKQAINALFGENNQLAPPEDIQIFTPELKSQAEEILRLQREKKNVAEKKFLFMTQMLSQCAKLVAKYTPLPGQPLLGSWNGSGACSVTFEVAGAGQGGKYAVTGGTQGTMQADTQGKGAIQANPFSGNVIDSPQSGTGQLTHPTFFKTKAGTSPCNVNVALKTPKSPIPANYKTAMQVMGKCLRNTAVFISPVFDRMFQDMNPQLSTLLQQRFLDLN